MPISQYTNQLDLWQEVGQGYTNFCLWNMDHTGPSIPISTLQKNDAWQQAKYIFLIGKEADPQMLQIINEDERVHVWDSMVWQGQLRWNPYFWWWQQVKEVSMCNNLVDRLIDPRSAKNNLAIFECMLGVRKPASDFLYESISTDLNLSNSTLLNYLAKGHSWITACDIDKANPDIPTDPGHSGHAIYYNSGQQITNISTLLPEKIYNKSWFSLIVESRTNHTRFFSEKTAKPLLGHRLFVLFAAPGMLADLKNLGFKTFDTIIDETYDHTLDDKSRWQKAFDQVVWLSKQNPKHIYQQALSILQHNRRHFLSINWTQNMVCKMQQILGSHKYKTPGE
jgi:hypothetical protein